MPVFSITEKTTKADFIAWNMDNNLDLSIKSSAFSRPDVDMVFNTELEAPELPAVPALTLKQKNIAELRRECLDILELLKLHS